MKEVTKIATRIVIKESPCIACPNVIPKVGVNAEEGLQASLQFSKVDCRMPATRHALLFSRI